MILREKKILFVSSNLGEIQTGAGVCSRRNREICKSIFGENNIGDFHLSFFSLSGYTGWKKVRRISSGIWNLMQGYSNGSNKKVNQNIIYEIQKNRIDYVFVDSSLNGLLVKQIKKETSAIVLVFFHNCEKYMIKGVVKNGSWETLLRYIPVCLNEKLSCIYADKIIVLNQRDADLIALEYKRIPDLLFPISLSDYVDETKLVCREIKKKKRALFVGSYFFGNVEGLDFFIQKVFPFVDIELIIVGRGMNRLKVNSTHIHIYDGVTTLEPFYLDADFVIAPIISGGGMKVKIAEAMMYGKIIIGTPEAFEGYESVPYSYVCKEPVDFIQAINSLSGNSYNKEIRDCFKNNYETNVLVDRLRNLFLS